MSDIQQRIDGHIETTAYTVSPLEWKHSKNEYDESWSAETIFCTISVRRSCYNDDGVWSSWKFEWCRDEYYQEGSEEVGDERIGMRIAERWYLSQLLPALQPAKKKARKQ